jgi:hypothetical protein
VVFVSSLNSHKYSCISRVVENFENFRNHRKSQFFTENNAEIFQSHKTLPRKTPMQSDLCAVLRKNTNKEVQKKGVLYSGSFCFFDFELSYKNVSISAFLVVKRFLVFECTNPYEDQFLSADADEAGILRS